MTQGIFQIDQEGPTLVVTPTSDLRELEFDRIEAGAAEVLQSLEEGRATNVIVDLKNSNFCGSTALGFFVKLWKRVKTSGGQMVFCGVSVTEQAILKVTHLDTLWPQRPDLKEAFALIQSVESKGDG
jgi:anti-anti-sigma factor